MEEKEEREEKELETGTETETTPKAIDIFLLGFYIGQAFQLTVYPEVPWATVKLCLENLVMFKDSGNFQKIGEDAKTMLELFSEDYTEDLQSFELVDKEILQKEVVKWEEKTRQKLSQQEQ